MSQLRANLARVLGADASEAELEETLREAMRSYARYWVETFRLPSISGEQVLAKTTMEGFEHVERAVAAGRGVILALPHSGSWDAAGIYLVERGYPFTTVAERLKPESLYRRFVAYRESLGMRVLALTGGPPTAPLLADVLADGGVVCLLGDRSLRDGGIEVPLFGEQALLPAGPAMLAARTGAALIPVGCSFTADGWAITVNRPIVVESSGFAQRTRDLTMQMASAFEAHLRAHPADWHMLHAVWVADRQAVTVAASGEGS